MWTHNKRMTGLGRFVGAAGAVVMCLCFVAGITMAAVNPGCAGRTARQHVALPAVTIIAPGVEDDARAGLAAKGAAGEPNSPATVDLFFAGIKSGDIDTIVVQSIPLWPEVRGYAEAGINAAMKRGTISKGLAESKLERLVQYESVLLKLAR